MSEGPSNTKPVSPRKHYSNLKKQLKSVRGQMKTAAKKLFTEESKALFKKHPGLESFSWQQYTPYFADGDPCTFGVYNDSPYIEFDGDPQEGEEEYDEDAFQDGYYVEDGDKSPKANAARDVAHLLGVFAEEDYENMFGDHVRVTVTSKGATTEEYSHD